MTDRPTVSVVVPVHNAVVHIPAALEHLAALRGDHEIVFIDDGSTDGSAALLEAVAAQAPHVRVLRNERKLGSALSRDRGVDASNGRYIWFCDIDDRWDSGILEVLVAAAERQDADIVCCRAHRTELDGYRWLMEGYDREHVAGPELFPFLVYAGRLRGYLWNKLFRREVLVRLERPRLSSQDDFLVVLDALTVARRVVFLPEALYEYVEQLGSISVGGGLNLVNLQICSDRARSLFRNGIGDRRVREQAESYFRLWFHLVPAITTPVHQQWDPAEAAELRRRLAPRLRWRMILSASRIRRPLAVHALLIKAGGPLFPLLYRIARRSVASRHSG